MSDIDNNVPAPVVPVIGEGLKNGYRKEDTPDGLITWEEHWEAWFAYHEAYPRGATAEETANSGGFTFNELSQWLGHAPKSWIPRDMTMYRDYFDNMYNSEPPTDEIEELPPVEVKQSHLWYGDGTSICTAEIDAPTTPFNFDVVEGPSCEKCLDKVLSWLRMWHLKEE